MPADISEQAKWIQDPYILPKKSKNQTCNMFLNDLTPHVFISQILQWKNKYPEAFFTDQEGNSKLRLCTDYSGTVRGSATILTDRTDLELEKGQFYKILRRKLAPTMNFFNFSTSSFDLKPKWPEYIYNFVQFYNSQNVTKKSNQSGSILWKDF